MGGGGSSRSYGKPLIERLSKVAEKAFDEAEPQRRNVFISFDYRDVSEVNLLRGQAKNEDSELEFNDYSVKEAFNSERAEYVRAKIREKIRQASVTLVYVTDKTYESEWVDWEVRESRAQGKGVLCVFKGANPPAQIPGFVREFNLKLIRWNHAELSKEIDDASKRRS